MKATGSPVTPVATFRATVGIFAYNEQATIRQVVEGFLAQKVSFAVLCEVVVVCCGCTDETVPIVRQIAVRDSRVRLIARPRREGKVAAINEFLRVVESDLLVLSSGDVVPANNVVELLVSPFAVDDLCMMTGPRVLVATRLHRRHVVDQLQDVLWALHHSIALRCPKLGETVAVRRDVLGHCLPAGVHCDEALMESIVLERGGKLGYVSEALVYNFPPASISELYQQRRRVAAQHRTLKRLRGYRPSTSDARLIVNALRTIPWTQVPLFLFLAVLEGAARIHGYWDSHRGRSYRLWRVTRPESRGDHHVLLDDPAACTASERAFRRDNDLEGFS